MGILGNGFIALVNCIDWVKRRKISSVDQLLTALAISRITMTWLVFLDGWISVLYPALYFTGKMLRLYLITWAVINHCNLWLTTILNMFYFLKIANFSNTIFLYLKFRIKNAILVTLLVSLFFLVLNIVVMKINYDMCIDDVQRNVSYTSRLYNYEQICRFLFFKILCFHSHHLLCPWQASSCLSSPCGDIWRTCSAMPRNTEMSAL